MTKEADLIEAHDGMVRAIRVCRGSCAVVIFDHLAVYCEIEDEVFEIWSYRGDVARASVMSSAAPIVALHDSATACDASRPLA